MESNLWKAPVAPRFHKAIVSILTRALECCLQLTGVRTVRNKTRGHKPLA
jgi:hypothetical protein